MSTFPQTVPFSSELRESEDAPPNAIETPSGAVLNADPFDTPIFRQLVSLVKEQNARSEIHHKSFQEQKEAILDIRRAVENLGRQMNGKGKGVVKDFQEEADVEMSGGRPSSVQMGGDLKMESPRSPVNETLQRLSTVIETVKDTLGNMKDTLLDHGKKFDILIRDAIKDDQPYDQKELDDESTCTALFEMAMTKTKEEVDEWIKRMDVSLVFIALFSAVLTAFVVPATQNLFPSSNNTPGNPTDLPPPLPKVSAENVCVSYYLALILAILDAVLSVLGRQWMSKLTNRPEGGTYKERLLRHLERERLAKRWLRYLVEGLHVILLWSIGLFVSGLLYQLWNLSGSFEDRAPRLLATWCLGLLLSLSILGVVLGATLHALIYEASPFGGPFSRLIFLAAKRMAGFFEPWMERIEDAAKRLDNRCKNRRRLFRNILPFLGRLIAGPLWLSSQLVDVWRLELELDDEEKLLTTYMGLIAEASDPKLLERAVGSFSYVEWFKSGDGMADQLKKTWNRLTATDTSVRVRETLRARMDQFVKYHHEKSTVITWEQIRVLANACPLADRFTAEVYSASFKADNADLRPLSLLPFEESVAQVLCSYNHKGELGDRTEIFFLAESHCVDLLRMGREDDVTRILSHVDRLDLIYSFTQSPRGVWPSVVEFIVKDRKHEILRKINEFVKEVDESKLDSFSLSRVFSVLVSPPPTDLDLCPHIDYLSRHPRWATWDQTSDAIIAYLNSFPLSQFSDPTTVRRFLQRCVDNEFRDEDGYQRSMDDDTRARARDLLAELDSLSFPLTVAIASASISPASPSPSLSHAPTPNDAPQPSPLPSPSAHSPAPAPAHVDLDTVPSADPDSAIPMLTLNHPPPMIASSKSESEPSIALDSQAVFDQSPALENAHKED
ncbi:hypothetical protein SISNIDRAFT_489612 [Sistotremastrum niveocremeum HHB9708]|uniref:DUF6535 domain-containing protein n=1 Tax=Sistotremastrum niveocremeum HHB9708 TaxID=1314777 RepID=A0A164PR12_9AGAM|nr:hypothetical protein SISNIDRAFT_489612 [Sistotremastrum niveocremeum HHB9708]